MNLGPFCWFWLRINNALCFTSTKVLDNQYSITTQYNIFSDTVGGIVKRNLEPLSRVRTERTMRDLPIVEWTQHELWKYVSSLTTDFLSAVVFTTSLSAWLRSVNSVSNNCMLENKDNLNLIYKITTSRNFYILVMYAYALRKIAETADFIDNRLKSKI